MKEISHIIHHGNVERVREKPVSADPRSQEQVELLYETVELRKSKALDLFKEHPASDWWLSLRSNDWKRIGYQDRQGVQGFLGTLFERTKDVFPDKHRAAELLPNLTADYHGLVDHIMVMQNVKREYYRRSSKFREDCWDASLDCMLMMDDLHDINRFAGINGPMPLHEADAISEELIEQMFPHFPPEMANHIDYVLGTKDLPSPTTREGRLQMFHKLVDTTGKPKPRFVSEQFDVFLAEHNRWTERQEKNGIFPLYVPKGESYLKVSSERYQRNDVAYTVHCSEAVDSFYPELRYNDVLARAADARAIREARLASGY
jgi:hypothetical protein